ncbi:MAG: response regulator transcription factor [Ardenticatenaceae bacterium]|nr:response regulator transcription factor [Ardenticatenaceae bacterium]
MKLLIVEDDLALSDVLAFTLRRAGFETLVVHDGVTAVATWQKQSPDLVVLDLNLPKLDGLGVCRHIRAHARTPIIILSVRGDDDTVVAALELGADDYIVKPFSPSQLVARVRAVLRRAGLVAQTGTFTAAAFTLDATRNEVQIADQPPIRLTPLEARLLEVLLRHAGQVMTTEGLITAVWGADGGDRTMLKQLVYRLRAKIEPDTDSTRYIETVAGIGYAFIATE